MSLEPMDDDEESHWEMAEGEPPDHRRCRRIGDVDSDIDVTVWFHEPSLRRNFACSCISNFLEVKCE